MTRIGLVTIGKRAQEALLFLFLCLFIRDRWYARQFCLMAMIRRGWVKMIRRGDGVTWSDEVDERGKMRGGVDTRG